MRRSDLARALEAIPHPPHPAAEREQYRTPAAIAAELLDLARRDGAVEGRRVLDLGCGTGTFAVGAALLGCRLATGVDADADGLALAREAARAAGVGERTWFVAAELADWRPEPGAFDAVVMNPPFGAQRGNRRADRLFYERAAEALRPGGGTCWFLALERSERFLRAFAGGLGASIERVAGWDYPLVATMAHHAREARVLRVGGYRMAVPGAP